jgi:hypothetical protein
MIAETLNKVGVTVDSDVKSNLFLYMLVLIVQGDQEMMHELLKEIMMKYPPQNPVSR